MAKATAKEVAKHLSDGRDPELVKLVAKRADEWGVSKTEALARLLGKPKRVKKDKPKRDTSKWCLPCDSGMHHSGRPKPDCACKCASR